MVRKILLFTIAFVSGAVVLAFEILGGQFLQPAFGSSIQVWGVVIGVFLGGLSLGYYLGGQISDRLPSFRWFGLFIFISGVLLLTLPFYATHVRTAIYDSLGMETVDRYGPLYTSLLLFLLPTVIMGMVSPYAVRLLADDPDRLGRQVGSLYAVSTLGSIAGALGTSFKLTYWLGTNDSIQLLGGIQIAAAVVAFLYSFFGRPSKSP